VLAESDPDWTVTVRRGPGTPELADVAVDGPGRPDLGSLGRFVLREEIGRGGAGVVYEAYDRESRAVVALKTLASMDAEEAFRLKHEFRALANLEHENFVRFEELCSVGGQVFFTMERVRGGDFLQYVRPEGRLDEPRLRKALAQLVEGLGALHASGRVHCDVKPSNVLVTTEGRVVLLDFGLTSRFGRRHGSGKGIGSVSGTPAFMAPEQMDGDALAPATDWYAAGVMLYAALTGDVPFRGDFLTIADAKRTGTFPDLAGGGIPDNLGALCTALLRPEAAARPGIREIRSRLGLSPPTEQAEEVFVGRQRELEQLRAAFAGARTATRALVLRGEPGIGKSALVARFLAGLRGEAIVLRGRCYEQESVPFGGVDSLIDDFSEYLLGLSFDDLEQLFAGGAASVARVFPVLYRVPYLAALRFDGPVVHDAWLRDLAIDELARIFAALGRTQTPVLFIDDLQWVDADSLALIREAFLSKGARCLFVATMRSTGEPSPELAAFVASLERLEVGPLSGDEALDVCDAGVPLEADVRERVLHEASGHPLFLSELLRSARSGKWTHDARVRLQDVLWRRIAERDDVERRFLEMAVLAGAPVPYTVLARAAGLDVGECRTRLAGLRAAQLVRVSRVDGERCVEPYHDRVREALFEHLGVAEGGRVARLHLQLGRTLLEATPEASLGARVFSIVAHMNAGRQVVDAPGEKKRLAELNLLASRQALTMTAFDRARQYADAGLLCLEPASGEEAAWSREPSLCRDLHLARMVGEYRSGHRDRAVDTFETAKRHLRDPVERAELLVAWFDLDGSSSMEASIAAGREILADLGDPLPRRATKLHVLFEYLRTRRSQHRRRAEDIVRSPVLRDPRTKSALRVQLALFPPVYMSGDTDLFAWMVLRQARVAMDRGISELAPVGLGGYGILLAVAFGKYDDAAAFGRLAVEMADRDKHPRVIASAHYGFGTLILPWVAPFDRAFEEIDKTRELARAYGDAIDEVFAHMSAALLSMAMGRDLEHTDRCAERAGEFATLCKEKSGIESMLAYRRHIRALRGETAGLADVSVPGSSQADFLASLTEEHGRVWMNIALAELSYLAGDVGRAESHLALFGRRSNAVRGMPPSADICLLSALVAAGGYATASRAGRLARLVRVAHTARKLDAWARSCPENFASHAAIARAELARIRGRSDEAADGYERAIGVAREHDAPKREAIACELAEQHARARGNATGADRYRGLAIEAYRRWGATAKVGMLERSPR
jgi:hypothetical protein